MFWGPSRLVWFAFGSVATWAYIRHHHQHPHPQHDWHHRVGCNAGPGRAQWEERERDQSPPNNNNASSSPDGRGDYGQWRPTQPQRQPQTQTQSESMTPMDVDHERLRQIGRNAEETISGMSEATIDSMMNVLQRLKDRLGERRGQQQLEEIGPQQTNSTRVEEPSGPRHRV